ncbi:MAG: Gfo/Idh/MocA family oxidoreductase [Verrucomicrobiota bacterium]|jgi:predicted dehydrogenase|nr:Gfo/Idh/MocA family oxidoreductase [Verrucomicrobiota bacterium]
MKRDSLSRRHFLKGSLLAAGAGVMGGCATAPRFRKPGETLQLGVIGTGGQGITDWSQMVECDNVHVAAMCDVDTAMFDVARKWYADKGRTADFTTYSDYRKLLETEKHLDAVLVATPDHTHAPAAIQAMKRGCHVYVEKPLVRTIWEARYFESVAKENGVITQMGNHGSAMDGTRRGVEILRSGLLGNVTEVHVWTNRPEISPGNTWGWKQPLKRPEGADPIPPEISWDLWLGTSPARPFKRGAYHRIMWRAFYDFGTGAFGDMACHTMNLAFRGLELGEVVAGEAVEISEHYDDTYPQYSKVRLTYAARGAKPPVELYWYDGYRKPPAEIMPQVIATLGQVPTTGCFILGDRGVMVNTDDYGESSYIALKGEEKMKAISKHEACAAVPVSLPRAKNQNQRREFIDACFGLTKTTSGADHSVPLVESMLVGCLAQRVPGKLTWDAARCLSDNAQANAYIKPFVRPGWNY